MPALCRVSLWLQAKLNIVVFTGVILPLFPFLSGLFHTPVLYSSPLARIILSHFLDKGLGGQNCVISVLTGRAHWVERGNFSRIEARNGVPAPSLD